MEDKFHVSNSAQIAQNCLLAEGLFKWEYFFGGGVIGHQQHYYKCEVNGKRLEKHTFRGGVEYSIGNMDESKKKFKSEKELLQAICEVWHFNDGSNIGNCYMCERCERVVD